MDPNAVNVLREFLMTSAVVYSTMEASAFNITVSIDRNMNALFTIEFPRYWGMYYQPSVEIPSVRPFLKLGADQLEVSFGTVSGLSSTWPYAKNKID
jgi:hypothetical protein